MKKCLCLLLCALLLPLGGLAESVEDAIIIGMISTRTLELNPLEPTERDIMSLYGMIYESLVTIDDNGIPQPLLAESWSESGDGKTWTFVLRENVAFSDGTPLTAQDVAASGAYLLNKANSEEEAERGFYANMRYMVSSFTARDERTLEVKAARPYYGLLYAMTFPVVPAAKVGTAQPEGTGPYLVTDFVAGSYLMLDANPGWWQMQPQVKSITVTFYSSNKDMISAYEYGRVDTVFTRSVAAAQYRSGNTSLSITYSTRQLEVLLMNHRQRSFPLDNVNIRKAIRYAINKELLSRNVYMGMTAAADTPYPADSWLYYDQESAFVYNPDKAREIIAAEGWKDTDNEFPLDYPVEGTTDVKHFWLKLYVYEDPENDVRYETAYMIEDMLREVGIGVKVYEVSYEEGKAILEAGSFDLFLCSFQMDVVPDPGFFLRKGNTQNYIRYSSSAMTELIDKLRGEEEQADFAYTSQEIQQLFEEEVPFLCLFYRTGALLTRKMYTTVRAIREFELLRGIESFGR